MSTVWAAQNLSSATYDSARALPRPPAFLLVAPPRRRRPDRCLAAGIDLGFRTSCLETLSTSALALAEIEGEGGREGGGQDHPGAPTDTQPPRTRGHDRLAPHRHPPAGGPRRLRGPAVGGGATGSRRGGPARGRRRDVAHELRAAAAVAGGGRRRLRRRAGGGLGLLPPAPGGVRVRATGGRVVPAGVRRVWPGRGGAADVVAQFVLLLVVGSIVRIVGIVVAVSVPVAAAPRTEADAAQQAGRAAGRGGRARPAMKFAFSSLKKGCAQQTWMHVTPRYLSSPPAFDPFLLHCVSPSTPCQKKPCATKANRNVREAS